MPGAGQRDVWLKKSVVNSRRKRPNWYDDAACVGLTDIFFPSGDLPKPEKMRIGRQAVRVCREECPVRADCLEYAVSCEEGSSLIGMGIWGGYTAVQLRAERARRRREALAGNATS